ncbi:hypothetical protein RDWZM_006812 [Blomia tropicalis]|uniref:Uncharacterized protein n=1 Tax=Blomia tropicalis TaxID=40697 RepID=A0A9Q0MC48_BLOTA|nr:hypothetical protein RDWZM_006812 [Blomia tropicalis]
MSNSLVWNRFSRIIFQRYLHFKTITNLSITNGITRKSGYESETAEIKDSLDRFTVENFQFDIDDNSPEEKVIPHLTHSVPLRSKKSKSMYKRSIDFVDFRRVSVTGGNGGNGKICFLHLWSNPNAGPSGGDGGNGGHVIFEASKNVKSLNYVQSKITGSHGEHGQHKDMCGASADHLVIEVPVGTLVKDATTGKLIADMNQLGMKFLAARGGAGGKGNHYFLNNKNRHPRVAEIGATGETKTYFLELKMIAHAGLVGFPNAGKSTLLSAVSRAKPKIASYPFTTLKPTVGMIQYDDGEQLAIADLPGLIEDAHLNKGLGIDFLRHIDRCVCVFYVIDMSANDPFEQLQVLMNELEQYKANLSNRPVAIIANKMDLEETNQKLKTFQMKLCQNDLSHFNVIPVSAKFGHNLTELLVYFRELYDLYRYEKFTDIY